MGHSRVDIVEGDILKVRLPSFNKVVGTPPYYISSKLILWLGQTNFDRALVVLQKEFGERLSASPGTDSYGRITVTAQYMFDVTTVLTIPPTAFDPPPRVDSVLLSITPKPPPDNVDRKQFDDLVRGIFTQRRRLVRGALSHHLQLKLGKAKGVEVVKRLSLPDLRVYQLSVERLQELATALSATIGDSREDRS